MDSPSPSPRLSLRGLLKRGLAVAALGFLFLPLTVERWDGSDFAYASANWDGDGGWTAWTPSGSKITSVSLRPTLPRKYVVALWFYPIREQFYFLRPWMSGYCFNPPFPKGLDKGSLLAIGDGYIVLPDLCISLLNALIALGSAQLIAAALVTAWHFWNKRRKAKAAVTAPSS